MTRWEIDQPRELTFDPVRSVHVTVVSGNVNVVGADGPVRLEVTRITAPPLVVEQEGEELLVAYRDWPWRGVFDWVGKDFQDWSWKDALGKLARLFHARYQADVTLAVPYDSTVKVNLLSGPVVLSDLAGEVSARTMSGTLTLQSLAGRVDAEVVSGDIEAESVAGDLRASVMSGSVVAAGCLSRRVDARATSGDITLDLANPHIESVAATTVSGEVIVRIPRDACLEVSATAVSGKLASAFEELRAERGPGQSTLSGRIGSVPPGRGVPGRLSIGITSGHGSILRSDQPCHGAKPPRRTCD
ncbi:DUF4097 family beta strand repeat-containing protein [Carbonactinospora thermoautotrophica]|uniref:DUF4097 family beta strand repeat-containing protein n=1 Tax=Carbonactinospora thermoautotrophica TaxID=1469144 RepID=UPI00226D70B1|nr:DUF4097 family beta strand repeat-containing protein [Carbonactinospora thermoautotrophica]